MFKRELRLERFDYEILTTNVGRSAVDLTYDRGLILNGHAPAKVDVILQVVTGSGIDPAVDEGFDRDNYKNLALRVVRPFGDARVGLFGYWGREREPGSGGTGPTNGMTYWGPDVVLGIGERWGVPSSTSSGATTTRDSRVIRAPSTDPRRFRGGALLPGGAGRPLGPVSPLQQGLLGLRGP